jgi:hypothetical protein
VIPTEGKPAGGAKALHDSEFATVLNHLYVMSRETRFDDEKLAEALIRAAVLLLTVRDTQGRDPEEIAQDMLHRALEWCQRMTPNR